MSVFSDVVKYLCDLFAVALAVMLTALPFLCRAEVFMTGITARFVCGVLLAFLSVCLISSKRRFGVCYMDLFLALYAVWWLVKHVFSILPFNEDVLLGGVNVLLFYFIVRNLTKSGIILAALFIGGLIHACFAILPYSGLVFQANPYFSVTGYFNNPGILAIYLFISVCAGFFLLRGGENKYCRLAVIAGEILLLVTLFAIHSRASWLALAAAGGYWLAAKYLRPDHLFRRKRFSLWVTGGILAGIPVLYGLYRLNPASADGRLLIWQVSGTIWREAFGTGHGVSSFQALYMPFQARWFGAHPESVLKAVAGNSGFAFNEYLEIACETGMIGLLLFIIFLGYYLFLTFGCHGEKALYGAGVTGISVFALFGYPFSIPVVLYCFVLLVGLSGRFDRRALTVVIPPAGYTLIVGCISVFVCFSALRYRVEKKADIVLQRVTEGKADVHALAGESFRQLRDVPDFVLCYGKNLFLQKYYQKALPVLQTGERLKPSSNLTLDLGTCYRHTGDYPRAEIMFRRAGDMVPMHILPKYHLFELYRLTGRRAEAAGMARCILSMPVKVTNTTVIRARKQARDYLNQFKPERRQI